MKLAYAIGAVAGIALLAAAAMPEPASAGQVVCEQKQLSDNYVITPDGRKVFQKEFRQVCRGQDGKESPMGGPWPDRCPQTGGQC